MHKNKVRITFYPDKKTVTVAKGTDLLTAAMMARIHIYSSCGGEGVCGRCKIMIKAGKIDTEPSGRLSLEERKKGYCLACRTYAHEDLVVEIPPESLIKDLAILTEEAKTDRLAGLYSPTQVFEPLKKLKDRTFTKSPLSTKLYLELPVPTRDDNISDIERLYREIRKTHPAKIMQISLSNVKKLGRLLREANWKVTATLGNRNQTVEIVRVEPGNTASKNYGIALDVGTTTVVAQLVDLNKYKVIASRASYNRQADFGEDVISRIIYAEEEKGLEKLHHAIIDTCNSLIRELAIDNSLTLNDIQAVLCAGNTTMTHLILKVNPKHVRRDPYVPTANFVPVVRAAEAGIKINARGLLYCVPGAGSYVGGDISAGVLASGLDTNEELSFLIDLGTNGEIVLGNKDWLISCATSAGPCFEGGGITSGIRAMNGAIEDFSINKDNTFKFKLIGEGKPLGICGSGLISIIGEFLRKDWIDRSGKFTDKAKKQIKEFEGEKIITLTGKVVITESDIGNFIHSKGAVFTGLSVLLKEMNLEFKDVKTIYLSGGFGTSLDIEKAIAVGLLPDIKRTAFKLIGNSSLSGARACLLSGQAQAEVEEISRQMTVLELSNSTEFMNNYSASLFLPHTNLDLFPSCHTQ